MTRNNYAPYITISREEWAKRSDDPMLHLLNDIDTLQGLNEPLTMDEITQIYVPLSRLLNLYVSSAQRLHAATNSFLGSQFLKVPFIIGIAGSVAVGKSTTARVLQRLLSAWPNHPKVDLVTTDGFLYPNRVLEQRGIMNRKGFPESYDIRGLIQFLANVKSARERVAAPVYSHLEYDILPNQLQWIESPDIVIVEGINVLQVRPRQQQREPTIFVSDFFDFSIYVDAELEDLQQWYIARFKSLRQTAFQNPDSYFHRYAHLSDAESEEFATNIWNEINKPNLELNIMPTRFRASLILEKGSHHFVQSLKLRRI
ncbi:type I pantothenate kinase [Chitinophaga filiformis]|uniref:Pantothenate kinase n=1 Tax=Chitinophaga filiformis TaxID=104663 RepID=A0A1G7RAC6_CHIFI|nr:type I pantothenate kinase [Chitinophaga filiformis]SDG07717.1 pantothenate kinase [Chitinophaga filiformis]